MVDGRRSSVPSRSRHPGTGLRAPLASLLASSVLALPACRDAVEPGPGSGPDAIRALDPSPRVGLAGVPLADSLVVEVTGVSGPMAGVTVEWAAAGSGEIRPSSGRTDERGRARALWIPGAGADSVRASVGPLATVIRGRGETARAETLHFGRNGYVEYRAGTLPIVLSAPHGGALEPAEIPDRTAGTTVRDRETDLLATAVADALEARTGGRPHLIVSHLHRRKLDPNREIVEAAAGDPRAEQAWYEFQLLIEHARARVVDTHGSGLYLDLHGHGHAIPRLELGYLLDADDLARSDAELDGGTWSERSSIRALAGDAGVPFSALLRGPFSLGGLLEEAGVPATPSPGQPDPGGAPFFSGGYDTARHGSRDGGPVSGVQIETHFEGIRDSAASRAAFAAALAEALERYLERWYGYLSPLPSPASPGAAPRRRRRAGPRSAAGRRPADCGR